MRLALCSSLCHAVSDRQASHGERAPSNTPVLEMLQKTKARTGTAMTSPDRATCPTMSQQLCKQAQPHASRPSRHTISVVRASCLAMRAYVSTAWDEQIGKSPGYREERPCDVAKQRGRG